MKNKINSTVSPNQNPKENYWHIIEMTREKTTNKTINQNIKNLNEDNKKTIERTTNETNNYSTSNEWSKSNKDTNEIYQPWIKALNDNKT